MDRDQLSQLLETGNEAFARCRKALLAGARFWVDDPALPAAHFHQIYRVREKRARRDGHPSVGFGKAVDRLHAAGGQLVRLGAVDVEDPPYHFQLFLNAAGTEVVACLGVDQHSGHRLKPGDQALLDCQAVEWVDTEWPGWIRVTFADAAGRAWSLVDKVPVLTEADIAPHDVLPKLIPVGCRVTEVARDDPGSPPLLTVSTGTYGVATEDGIDCFTVRADQVRPSLRQ